MEVEPSSPQFKELDPSNWTGDRRQPLASAESHVWLTVAPSLMQPGLLVYSMQTSTTQLALGRQIEEDDKTVCEKSKQFFCSEQSAMGAAQAIGAMPTASTSKENRMVGFFIMVVVFDRDFLQVSSGRRSKSGNNATLRERSPTVTTVMEHGLPS